MAPAGSHGIQALHAGDVRLSEIPEHLMVEGAADRRETWLEDQLSPESKEWLAACAEIAKSIIDLGTDEEGAPTSRSREGGEA